MVLQTKTSVSLVLVAVAVMIATGSAYAQEQGMTMTVTAQDGSDTISIMGHTESARNDVTIRIEAPNRNLIYAAQVSPDESGNFEKLLRISDNSIAWKQDGFYKISAYQGSSALYELSAKVQIISGETVETQIMESTTEKIITRHGEALTTEGMTITAEAMEGSDRFTIVGTTDRTRTITLKTTAPNGNVISADQIAPRTDGTFSLEVIVGGPLWQQDGTYTVTARQGDSLSYQSSTQIDVIEGVVIPEFGSIAALILAIAIISIIAISARSRLSIMPKY